MVVVVRASGQRVILAVGEGFGSEHRRGVHQEVEGREGPLQGSASITNGGVGSGMSICFGTGTISRIRGYVRGDIIQQFRKPLTWEEIDADYKKRMDEINGNT
jgi:hypothetical protein